MTASYPHGGKMPTLFFRLCPVYILVSKYSFLQEMMLRVESWCSLSLTKTKAGSLLRVSKVSFCSLTGPWNSTSGLWPEITEGSPAAGRVLDGTSKLELESPKGLLSKEAALRGY